MQACIRTVLKIGEGRYEEKRSRFLSFVYPVCTEKEALGYLAELKKEYWDARHHCFAYIIEGESKIQRFGDDGEPSGTAGLPILEAIRKRELTNVLVVVIRYFGGVLLGASGLVRAYGKAASAGLDDAGVVNRKLCVRTTILLEYQLYGKVQNFLAGQHFAVAGTQFTSNVEVELVLEPERRDFLEKEITELTGGKARIEYGQKLWANFDEAGNYIS